MGPAAAATQRRDCTGTSAQHIVLHREQVQLAYERGLPTEQFSVGETERLGLLLKPRDLVWELARYRRIAVLRLDSCIDLPTVGP